jgi:hypothetical protein
MTDQTMADALLWAFGVALFALMTWGCVAQRTPAAALRRLLTFLHHLGGATLVWDVAQGGDFFRSWSWRDEDGLWHALQIEELHLLDAAGHRVPLPDTWPCLLGTESSREERLRGRCAHPRAALHQGAGALHPRAARRRGHQRTLPSAGRTAGANAPASPAARAAHGRPHTSGRG